jgi:hypothetical protein
VHSSPGNRHAIITSLCISQRSSDHRFSSDCPDVQDEKEGGGRNGHSPDGRLDTRPQDADGGLDLMLFEVVEDFVSRS